MSHLAWKPCVATLCKVKLDSSWTCERWTWLILELRATNWGNFRPTSDERMYLWIYERQTWWIYELWATNIKFFRFMSDYKRHLGPMSDELSQFWKYEQGTNRFGTYKWRGGPTRVELDESWPDECQALNHFHTPALLPPAPLPPGAKKISTEFPKNQ